MRTFIILVLSFFVTSFSYSQTQAINAYAPEVYYGISQTDSIDTSKVYIMVKFTVNLPEEIKEVSYKFREEKLLASNTIKEEKTIFSLNNNKKVYKANSAQEYELIGPDIIFHLSINKLDYIKVNKCKITVEDNNGNKSNLTINL